MGKSRMPAHQNNQQRTQNAAGKKQTKMPMAINGLTNMQGAANRGKSHLDFNKSFFTDTTLLGGNNG